MSDMTALHTDRFVSVFPTHATVWEISETDYRDMAHVMETPMVAKAARLFTTDRDGKPYMIAMSYFTQAEAALDYAYSGVGRTSEYQTVSAVVLTRTGYYNADDRPRTEYVDTQR